MIYHIHCRHSNTLPTFKSTFRIRRLAACAILEISTREVFSIAGVRWNDIPHTARRPFADATVFELYIYTDLSEENFILTDL